MTGFGGDSGQDAAHPAGKLRNSCKAISARTLQLEFRFQLQLLGDDDFQDSNIVGGTLGV